MRVSLPVISNDRDVLDRIEIPIPCHVPWADMTGDDRVRFCGDCRQNVYNVAAFSRAEATRLLNDSSGRVCLRIFRRPDGTVITDDCRARLRAARKRGLLIFAGALVVVLWAQICAQFVGLMGLRRVLSTRTMGEAPAMMTGAAPPPPSRPAIEVTGARLIRPEPAVGDVEVVEVNGDVVRPMPTLGKPAPAIKGRIRVKPATR
jgi:hypothetical protein